MKAALRPALPLLIGIALAAVLALVAMHSLAVGTAAPTLAAHPVAVSGHSHGGDAGVAVAATANHATHDGAASMLEQAAPDHADATHGHGASTACAAHDDTECCSSVANASGAPTITVHAYPGATVSALPASVPTASLLATEAAERPPSRALLSVIRV